MQLSLHADYACRVLIYLSTATSEKSSIEEIARSFKVSQNHLVKVVHRLGKLGFIETMRGRGGGIRLAKQAQQISIGQVIRQTEPGFDVVECFNIDLNTCPISGSCKLKPWLAKAMDAFLQTLDGVTLADITKSNKRKIAEALFHNEPDQPPSRAFKP